jgi:hypothetical protein
MKMLVHGAISRTGGRGSRDMIRLICLTTRKAGNGLVVASLEMGRGCVKGPHAGTQYLGLAFATTGDAAGDEGLPNVKHQKMDIPEPERKFSNSVADLLDRAGGAESVVLKEVV